MNLARKVGRPASKKPYRQKNIRFSMLEDTLLDLLREVSDDDARKTIEAKLGTLKAKQIELMQK